MKNLKLSIIQRIQLNEFCLSVRGERLYRVCPKFADRIELTEAEEKTIFFRRVLRGGEGDLLQWDNEKADALPPVEYEVKDSDAAVILQAIQTQGQFCGRDRVWLDPVRAMLGEDREE